MITREKIDSAIRLDLKGLSKPLDILIDAGSDELWNEILSFENLRPKQLERIYANKVINRRRIDLAITHPQATERMFRHVSQRGSVRDIENMLSAHSAMMKQKWFLGAMTTQPAVRKSVETLGLSAYLSPSDVKGLPPKIASVLLNARMPSASIIQVLMNSGHIEKIKKLAVDLQHAKKDILIISDLERQILSNALKHEKNRFYRERLTELIILAKQPGHALETHQSVQSR